tara:strand:- start:597 stop:1037 length:441 start_codon:yes stop_codon:yes gene_type:complete
MSSYIQTTAEFKSVVDGDIVEQVSLDATYDGKKAEIKSYSDGTMNYVELDNDDIMALLSLPSSNISLEQRLIEDHGTPKHMTKKRHSTRRRHKTKHRHSTRRKTKTKTKTKSKTKTKTKTKTRRHHKTEVPHETKNKTPEIMRTIY